MLLGFSYLYFILLRSINLSINESSKALPYGQPSEHKNGLNLTALQRNSGSFVAEDTGPFP